MVNIVYINYYVLGVVLKKPLSINFLVIPPCRHTSYTYFQSPWSRRRPCPRRCRRRGSWTLACWACRERGVGGRTCGCKTGLSRQYPTDVSYKTKYTFYNSVQGAKIRLQMYTAKLPSENTFHSYCTVNQLC